MLLENDSMHGDAELVSISILLSSLTLKPVKSFYNMYMGLYIQYVQRSLITVYLRIDLQTSPVLKDTVQLAVQCQDSFLCHNHSTKLVVFCAKTFFRRVGQTPVLNSLAKFSTALCLWQTNQLISVREKKKKLLFCS
jgi:hypothetical protein